MSEVDLESDYKERLIYKYSTQGRVDRKIASIRRRGKKKYAKAGCIFGLLSGVLVALTLLLVWGWVAL